MTQTVSKIQSVSRAIALAGALSLGMVSAAFSAEWRMAVQDNLDGPEGRTFVYFAEKVAEYSDGDLTVKIYPNEQLGKQDAVLEQLKLGAVQLYGTGSVFMQKFVPDIRWIAMAFIMDDRDHWVRFMHSDLVQSWYKEAEEQAGIAILGDLTGVLRGPYRVLLTDYEVTSIDDLSKLKLRLYQDKTANDVWTTLGAEPRVLGWAETYEAISRGIVNGVTAPIAVVENSKLYEVAPYIMRTDEYYQSIAFMMNKDQFDALPEKDQQALLKAHADASEFSVKETMEYTKTGVEELEAKGAKYSEPDLKPYIQKVQDLYKEMEERGELPEGLLEAIESTRNP